MSVTRLSNAFNGTSSGAPNLTGQAGSMVGVLDFCLVTTLGWTTAYTTTNKRSYRQPSGSNQFYLDVDDTNAQNTLLRGYETMSAIATGTGSFPTSAQLSSGVQSYKSTTADATARPWLFVSNGKIFYLFWQHSSLTTTGQFLCFGDFKSYKSGDAYNTILIGNATASAAGASISGYQRTVSSGTASTGHYCPRSSAQTGTSVQMSKGTNPFFTNGGTECGAAGATYPSPVDGGIILSPLWVADSSSGGPRGELPGLWDPAHARGVSAGDTFDGVSSTPLASKSFEAFNGGTSGQLIVETTNTWN